MKMPKRFHLFQVYGVELEYMIVDKDSLEIRSISDKILLSEENQVKNEWNNGRITWSNELSLHVLELKCTNPDGELNTLSTDFHKNVQEVNKKLEKFNAILMPTGAHPLMDPVRESKIWPHDQNEIYLLYDKLFNCKGHGWSNLQSTHINFPFYDDEEFGRLHTAIRLILPILPALTASTPILDGKFTGYLDKRLSYYQYNQRNIPSITGKVIPERVFSKRAYQKQIYDRIATDIRHHDPTSILDPVWVNSRGAIARFDRGSIEIRIIDLQESPKADISVVTIIDLLLKSLVYNELSAFEYQEKLTTEKLYEIFQKVIKTGGNSIIEDKQFLQAFGLNEDKVTLKELWVFLFEQLERFYPKETRDVTEFISIWKQNGSLAERLLSALGDDFDKTQLLKTYGNLCKTLKNNEIYY